MKRFLRLLARRFGYEFLHRTDDAVLQSLLDAYNDLRLSPRDLLRWDHRLAHLASLSHLRSQLHLHAIDLLIDVGANRGQFALDARRAGYTGEMLSFEPLAAHQAHLSNLAARDGRWRIFPCGLGATAAELDLHVYHDDTFSSVLTVNPSAQNNFGHLVALERVERISIRTLDEILAEREIGPARRIFLKTDTQGYDADVLAGAADTLRQTLAVLTEATVAPLYDGSSRLEEINALLLPLGFARAGLFPIGYAPETHTLIELDCFFCRPASHISPPQ
ncbi:FkbM family methyltransferase [Horticoccus luteus]|uniref:FkbM family methyltransferase n=1 Tax=Horticoccus luteus TaxID=2862869 RepID=A0A8F9TYI6_9BACT|nr:FkbM family methyltransferase [Horticoccus luteus]QYM80495.1 FkbM family methyltransferase [Horticoccus luteus]